jgi:hypothetical protein
MSAFVVGSPHIDAMVALAVYGPKGGQRRWDRFSYYHRNLRHEVNNDTADQLGSMLWAENERSVAYRYPDAQRDELPGPIEREEPTSYRFSVTAARPTAIEGLKLLRCFEYQSCETPDWEQSEAWSFCDDRKDCLVASLPGYDEAPWEWTGQPKRAIA